MNTYIIDAALAFYKCKWALSEDVIYLNHAATYSYLSDQRMKKTDRRTYLQWENKNNI